MRIRPCLSNHVQKWSNRMKACMAIAFTAFSMVFSLMYMCSYECLSCMLMSFCTVKTAQGYCSNQGADRPSQHYLQYAAPALVRGSAWWRVLDLYQGATQLQPHCCLVLRLMHAVLPALPAAPHTLPTVISPQACAADSQMPTLSRC